MAKIRKNDVVQVLAGKDRGKTGKVLRFNLADQKAIVEGVNMLKKHKRKTRDDQQGGVINKEAPIHVSNLSVFCKRCNKGVKVGLSMLKDGTKARFCKKCNEVF